jgi:hypothetical protein
VQYPVTDVDNEIRLLGNGDELGRRHQGTPGGCQRISASTPMISPATMCWGW